MDQIKELDRVKLINSIKLDGTIIPSGTIGTILYCFPRGYEIKFDGTSISHDVDAKHIIPYVEPVVVEELEDDYE